ncbi:MAG: hypothetical protein AAF394_02195, partial [Planctomycetota bacterium]
EIAKNLPGENSDKGKHLQAAKRIQKETGFAQQAELGRALSNTISASGGRPDVAEAFVRETARISLHEPQKVVGLSAGAMDIGNAVGSDPQESLGFLLDSARTSRVKDQAQLAKGLAPAVVAAVSASPKQDPREAAASAGALFGTIGSALADPTGDITKTATIQLVSKTREFFQNLPDLLKNKDAELKGLMSKQAITEREKLNIRDAKFRVQEAERELAGHGSPRTEEGFREQTALKINLDDARLRLKETIERSGITAEEKERLEVLKQQTAELKRIKERPGIEGKFESIRNNPALRDEFLRNSFGSEEAKAPIRELLTRGSRLARQFKANRATIDFERDTFLQAAEAESKGLTPEMAVAVRGIKAKAKRELRNSSPDRAAMAMIRKETMDVIKESPVKNIDGLMTDWAMNWWHDQRLAFSGSVEESEEIARGALQRRINSIERISYAGPSEQDRVDIRNLREAMGTVRGIRNAATGNHQGPLPFHVQPQNMNLPFNAPPAPQQAIPTISERDVVNMFMKATESLQQAAERLGGPAAQSLLTAGEQLGSSSNRPGAAANAQAQSSIGVGAL